MGPRASDAELHAVAERVRRAPRSWIAQPVVTFSTCDTVVDGGHLAARHVDLRPFAVNDGERIWVLPGGLTRVALPEGSLVVNSSQGGGSKDTWVLEDPDDQAPPVVPARAPARRITRVDTDLPDRAEAPRSHDERMRQQEKQQQQARAVPGRPPC
jgi:uncharacterized circularly permuted ATP-grasp superfamily protein